MRRIVLMLIVMISMSGFLFAQKQKPIVKEIDNSIFKKDCYWRGADGAATVELDSSRVLWLFSDTFIDQEGTGKRSNAETMIRNSIAIQDSNSLESRLTYYDRGTKQKPEDFLKYPGKIGFGRAMEY